MKSMITKSMLILAIALTTLSLNATAQDYHRRGFKASFAFTAGDQQLPAGDYVIEPIFRDSSTRLFAIRNTATNQQAIVHAIPTTRKIGIESGAVTFNRYDEANYLSLINMGETRYLLARSKAERDAEKQFVAKAKAKGQISEVRE